MALIERTAYPRFAPRPSARELARLYTPTLGELELARRTTRGGEAQQLAFLLMLKSFQRLGYFPKRGEVPEAVVEPGANATSRGPSISRSPGRPQSAGPTASAPDRPRAPRPLGGAPSP